MLFFEEWLPLPESAEGAPMTQLRWTGTLTNIMRVMYSQSSELGRTHASHVFAHFEEVYNRRTPENSTLIHPASAVGSLCKVINASVCLSSRWPCILELRSGPNNESETPQPVLDSKYRVIWVLTHMTYKSVVHFFGWLGLCGSMVQENSPVICIISVHSSCHVCHTDDAGPFT